MSIFRQERTKGGQLFPAPKQGEVIMETPPCFQWIGQTKYSRYRVIIKTEKNEIFYQEETVRNFLVPSGILPAGRYSYHIEALKRKEREWDISPEISFEISGEAVPFLRPSPEKILKGMPMVHPRMQFYESEISQICEKRKVQLEVLKRNVIAAYNDGMPEEPRFHTDENALPYREFFGRHRDYADRDLVACALAYRLLRDEQAGKFAKKSLLTICSWNPDGVCSLFGGYGDEIGLSHARILPTVYDLLFDLLKPEERQIVELTMAAYARQCEDRLKSIHFTQNPGNSHVGRIPAYMGEAALVLYRTKAVSEKTVRRWLKTALDIYGGIFPYFGTPDGGWAEGTFYSTSYTKWYLPFFIAIERFSGKSFLSRPFYRNVVDWFMHFASPEWENHSFCDGYWCKTDDPEWPGFFAQNPLRIYADRFGSCDAVKRSEKCDDQKIYKLHLLDIFYHSPLDEKKEQKKERKKDVNIRSFPEAGFVSLHTCVEDSGKDTALIARASKFGSCSHAHADQGSFALIRHGKTLISPSGYFGRKYGSLHHLNWTNTSMAHNVILVDGTGQKTFDAFAAGRVVSCFENEKGKQAVLDLSAAYENLLKKWIRTFVLNENKLIVEDEIECEKERKIFWLLHTLSEPVQHENNFELTRGDTLLKVKPVQKNLKNLTIRDYFAVDVNEGVPEPYQVEMPKQYHAAWITEPVKKHHIAVEFLMEDKNPENGRND